MKMLICISKLPYAETTLLFGDLIARLEQADVTLLTVVNEAEERPLADEDMRAFRRRVFAGAVNLEPDRQGRILLPQYLRDFADMNGDVVIAGMYDYLELWSAEAWTAVRESVETNDDADRWMDLGI